MGQRTIVIKRSGSADEKDLVRKTKSNKSKPQEKSKNGNILEATIRCRWPTPCMTLV